MTFLGFVGANVTNRKAVDAGLIIADYIRDLLSNWSFVPDGLNAVGKCEHERDERWM